MKVCHIVSGDLWAGAEVMAFNLLRGLLARQNTEPFAIVLNAGRLAEELIRAGVPTRVLDETKLSFREIASSARRLIKEIRPRVIHSHRYKENAIAYLASLTEKQRPVLVGTQHGMPEMFDAGARLRHRLKARANFWLLARRFDMTVAVSAEIASVLRASGFCDDRVETVMNGIEVPEIDRALTVRTGFAIGSAGRMVPVKDYALMVDIANLVVAADPGIHFELAGDGPLFASIQSQVAKLGLEDRFMLKGMVQKVGDFYRGLDVFINTSVHEGIPMSVLEAMALEIPPIVPRVGGMPEIISDGVDGYLVEGRDPVNFAQCCLALKRNDELRKRMGRAAREKAAKRFSWAKMVDRYMDVYTRTMEKSG